VFGAGGTAVEIVNDKALALPPLDLALARALIARTRVARQLKAYRNVPAADETAVALVLVKSAACRRSAAGARGRSQSATCRRAGRHRARRARCDCAGRAVRRGPLAIRALRSDLIPGMGAAGEARDGTAILIRPIRPEDEALYAPFFAEVTEQDLRLRFRTDQGIQPRFRGPLHPARLCACDGLHFNRPVERSDARRRAPSRKRRL
jgi:acetyltransferase